MNKMTYIANKKLSYFDLIPHDPLSLLHDPNLRVLHLNMYCFLIKNIILSLINFFEEKNYIFFDPHVGDTLCQTRAAQISYMAMNSNMDYKEAIYTLEIYYEKAANLLLEAEELSKKRRKKEEKRLQDHQTLENFFKEYGLDIVINGSVIFLVKTFLLTIYKIHEIGSSPRINYTQLQKDLRISKDLSYRIVRKWQRSIAYYSSYFIEKISEKNSVLIPILKRLDDDGREVLPSFFVMTSIINFLIKNKIGILLIIRHPQNLIGSILKKYYRASEANFVEVDYINREVPHFVVYLISKMADNKHKKELLNSISEMKVEDILLASVANHPQYSGKKLAYLNANPYETDYELKHISSPANILLKKISEEYLKTRSFALSVGCDYKNPSLFFVEHMFVGTLTQQNEFFERMQANFKAENIAVSQI